MEATQRQSPMTDDLSKVCNIIAHMPRLNPTFEYQLLSPLTAEKYILEVFLKTCASDLEQSRGYYSSSWQQTPGS